MSQRKAKQTRKLENAVADTVTVLERHDTELRLCKRRISMLENQEQRRRKDVRRRSELDRVTVWLVMMILFVLIVAALLTSSAQADQAEPVAVPVVATPSPTPMETHTGSPARLAEWGDDEQRSERAPGAAGGEGYGACEEDMPSGCDTEAVKRAWAERAQLIENCTVTYYDACRICCGKDDGITASGAVATPGLTVAVDPEVIPLGSDILVDYHDGAGLQYYRAEDSGVTGAHIDVCVATHEEALELGRRSATVYWLQ